MQNLMAVYTYSVLDRQYPFKANLFKKKKKKNLFKLKFDT